MSPNSSTVAKPASHSTNTTHLPKIIKGDSDWRNYQALLLDNGAKCILVNDPESKTTAMAVCVGSGASADPRELSGLAHFTEHMCFLGSEAYPGENEYKRYLSAHGGRSNASTSMSVTTYKFDVLAEHAEQAVDIFSHFFTDPLFSVSGTEREVNAVDSENSKNLISDFRRRLQVLKALADPNHHYSKFSTGNAKTLPAAPTTSSSDASKNEPPLENNVREAMLAFHKLHYRPDNMTIVIVGPQSLSTLQDWIVPRFASMQNRWQTNEQQWTKVEERIYQASLEAPPTSYSDPSPPYHAAFSSSLQNNQWPVLLTTQPLKSLRKLYLLFPIKSYLKHPDRSPVHFLCHLLGHEGKGSSFALLQDEGWLDRLSVGTRVSASDQYVLQIDVSLTELGEEKWKEVVRVLFEHCHLLHHAATSALKAQKKNLGTQGDTENRNDVKSSKYLSSMQTIWQELCTMESIDFHQTSPGQAYSFAPNLSQSVHYYGVEQSVSAGSMLQETVETLPLEAIVEVSERLVPKNCVVERCSKGAWQEVLSKPGGEAVEATKKKDGDLGSCFGMQTEPWYGVEYHLSVVDNKDVSTWEGKGNDNQAALSNDGEPLLHLPAPNLYIPRNLNLCEDLPEEARRGPRIEKEMDPPKLLVEHHSCGRLWHKLDDRYALPKSSLTILLRSAAVEHAEKPLPLKENEQSPSDIHDAEKIVTWSFDHDASIRSRVMVGAFEDAMAQETYDADIAGLSWSLRKSSSGLTLSCDGYSDRLAELALHLLRKLLVLPGESENEESGVANASSMSSTFIREKYVGAAKDRCVRSLRSYLQSTRADSLALYYTELFLCTDGTGIDGSLPAAERITLDDIRTHHSRILADGERDGVECGNHVAYECLFTGNVSEKEATDFFFRACDVLVEGKKQARKRLALPNFGRTSLGAGWIPGPFERKLNEGEDVELHFQSQNPEEENGAVLMTFQSGQPGYRGSHLSTPERLRQTAAMRLLCHILKEPLFDELRTKQQLGYVVSSYFDLAFSYKRQRSNVKTEGPFQPCTVPVDSIVVNVLSRKVPPHEVATRIDDFLQKFFETLKVMPMSEISKHADSLSKKLQKPVQKLDDEASIHFGKIHRYAPEVLYERHSEDGIPWKSARELAGAMRNLTRDDLLNVWKQVVAGEKRSRVVAFLYGNTFRMPRSGETGYTYEGGEAARIMKCEQRQYTSVRSLQDLFAQRGLRTVYGNRNASTAPNRSQNRGFSTSILRMATGKTGMGVATTAATVLGVGALGVAFYVRNQQIGGSGRGGKAF